MLKKSRGICLHSIKYSDSSIIVHIYTELFGRQSYMIKGVYGKRASIKSNVFYPLNLLELDLQQKSGSGLQSLKEVRNFPVYSGIPFNASKNAIALFISEILYRSLREEMPNQNLFEFVFNSLLILDLEDNVADFHLLFLVQLSKYIGFYPLNNYSEVECYFDLLNGLFVPTSPMHSHYLNKTEAKTFSEIMNTGFDESAKLQIPKKLRLAMLDNIVEYYCLHIDGIGKIKSLQILKELFE
jgi:DNA repair protein RecO (recombination protein O)